MVPPSGTRPTSDRVREAIFSSLDAWGVLPGAHIIDLYAGSGALGLEAISRGAMGATLVEKGGKAAQTARRNTHQVIAAYRGTPSPRVEVIPRSVAAFLESTSVTAEVIFIDPPYDLNEDALAHDLERVAGLLTQNGVVLVERSSRSPEPQWPEGLELFRRKDYGETTLWWADHGESTN
ncbi:16S rRNA (guanine966-N2)-methyltransferase [Klugiella xanthotipulae]|uniref:16S rRNA (Guanine966-N2)-methyltransferase n=1 Tax=Klugiella xanthotipulae TaxID=244735 RepID=A0A543HRT5_9MICO|nr:16S rRNA (guanine966-N2)-methyltransferase [Klugiella xanthotipulae]